jgi:Protein of unknown function (DUF2778)
MSLVAEWRYRFGDVQTVGEWSARPQRLMGAAAIACVAFICTWILIVNVAGPRAGLIDVSGTIFDDLERATPRGDRLAVATPSPRPEPQRVSKGDLLLFDPHFAMGTPTGTSSQYFADNAPAQPQGFSVSTPQPAIATAQNTRAVPVQNARIAQAPPLPQPAPPQTRTAALREGAHRAVDTAVADTRSVVADTRSIFEKLFGRPASSLTLAFADADTGSLGTGHNPALGLYDRETAVYDITAHKVYLPDGTALEAHSGLGPLLDDPRHADAKDRGVTPPAVYDLQPREAMFHGVEALRLIPEDEDKALGRTGLLAHSYMLGPNGDSNGCVSFRDYEAFLRAYKNHEITRLAVVARLD